MDDLIKALQILRKYTDTKYPTHCEHDELTICDVDPSDVSREDIKKLDDLGFFVDSSEDCFRSFRFGSC